MPSVPCLALSGLSSSHRLVQGGYPACQNQDYYINLRFNFQSLYDRINFLSFMSRFHTDPAKETLITTTTDGRIIGQARREKCHKGNGKTHWGLLAIVIRKNGKIVLAKRSQYKSLFANIWDGTVATHVLPGDTAVEAAYRETKEELGISVDFKEIGSFFYTAKDDDHTENEYCTLLIGTSSDHLKPNKKEVSQVKEISLAKLMDKEKRSADPLSPWLIIALERFGEKIRREVRKDE